VTFGWSLCGTLPRNFISRSSVSLPRFEVGASPDVSRMTEDTCERMSRCVSGFVPPHVPHQFSSHFRCLHYCQMSLRICNSCLVTFCPWMLPTGYAMCACAVRWSMQVAGRRTALARTRAHALTRRPYCMHVECKGVRFEVFTAVTMKNGISSQRSSVASYI
jgi:hypothetical protein